MSIIQAPTQKFAKDSNQQQQSKTPGQKPFNFSLQMNKLNIDYRKVASCNTSHLEAHAGSRLFQIAYEGDFRPLCTVTFRQKVDFLISNVRYYNGNIMKQTNYFRYMTYVY